MAVTIAPLGGLPSILKVIQDTTADNTAEQNVSDGPGSVYAVAIDNNLNAALTYVKFWDNAAPTVGTTAPDMILPADLSDRVVYVFRLGIPFATAISFAALTAGGTAGTTSPVSAVKVTLYVK